MISIILPQNVSFAHVRINKRVLFAYHEEKLDSGYLHSELSLQSVAFILVLMGSLLTFRLVVSSLFSPFSLLCSSCKYFSRSFLSATVFSCIISFRLTSSPISLSMGDGSCTCDSASIVSLLCLRDRLPLKM